MQEPSDSELRIVVMRLARAMRRNHAAEDVSDSQLAVLFRVAEVGETTARHLAAYESISPPAVHKTIGALEARGLIDRAHDEGDARRQRVRLTTDGARFVQNIRLSRDAWFSERLGRLSAAERQAIRRAGAALHRMVDDQ